MFWKAKRFGRRASEIFLKRHLRVRVLSPHPRSRGVSRHCAVRSFSACWQPVHMSESLIARPDIIFGKDRGIYPSPEAYRQAATWNGEFGQCGREAAHPLRALEPTAKALKVELLPFEGRNLVLTFPQRSPPSLLTTAACSGLRPEPDCRPRRTFLHLSYSYASPFGPAILVTHDPLRTPTALANNGQVVK